MKWNRLAAAALALLIAPPSFAAISREDLQAALEANPDLVLAALKKIDKKEFFAYVREAQRDYDADQRAEKAEKDKQEREDSFKNPLQPQIDASTRIRGDKSAPVTIVEYSDFQCPVCGRGFQVVEQVRQKYGAKVRFIYKHLPLVHLHPMAMPAAQWQEAVALQSPEKAWDFHDAMFKNQGALSEDFFKKTVADLGLDAEKAAKDAQSRAVAGKIAADAAEAQKFGFNGTPGFLVNGVPIRGLSRNPGAPFDEIIARLGVAD
ncbi:MAG: DsbA family protein [Elusimicrobiota bacterium]